MTKDLTTNQGTSGNSQLVIEQILGYCRIIPKRKK